MRWFWQCLIRPLLEAMRPEAIIEIGAEHGDVTLPLLEWADAHRAVVHVIDPEPLFDVGHTRAAHPGSFRPHLTRSLRVLPHIPTADLVLIDGDHNWHTVIGELRQVERRAARDDRLPPVILLHDVEWPYARRDLYYEPEAIPPARRQPYARAGIVPGRDDLHDPGLNPSLNNALHEGGERNGVLTAVEDFVGESRLEWSFVTVPGLYGLGILAPRRLVKRRPKLRNLIETTKTPEFLREQCLAIERARIAAVIRATERDPGT
jgi:Methyltransferase domain